MFGVREVFQVIKGVGEARKDCGQDREASTQCLLHARDGGAARSEHAEYVEWVESHALRRSVEYLGRY